MKNIVMNILTILMLIITTPVVLFLWAVIKGFNYCVKDVKMNGSDFWEIVNVWDEWLLKKLKSTIK